MAERASARTEEPTPRRLAEARRRGHVGFSAELTGAVANAALLVVLVAGGAAEAGKLTGYVRAALAAAPRGGDLAAALALGLRQATALLALPLGVACAITVTVGLVQTGGLFAPLAARFDPRRAVPAASRLLDAGALVGLAKGAGGALVLLGAACLTLAPWLRPIGTLAGGSAGHTLAAAGALSAMLAWRLAAVLVALGTVDLLWRRVRHRQSLRMTRAEVERERREQEGEPRHRQERRRLHREALAGNGLAEATFLVTGPRTAIALAWAGTGAPVVVARGERLLAARLIEAARVRRLPAFPDAVLAEALLAVNEGEEIPRALHDPVASIVKVIVEDRARAG